MYQYNERLQKIAIHWWHQNLPLLLFFNAISEIYLPDALSIAAGEVALPAAGQLEQPGVWPPLGAAGRVVALYLPGVGAQGVAGEGGLGRAVNGPPRSFHSARRRPQVVSPW